MLIMLFKMTFFSLADFVQFSGARQEFPGTGIAVPVNVNNLPVYVFKNIGVQVTSLAGKLD